jgi:hypothetical protein
LLKNNILERQNEKMSETHEKVFDIKLASELAKESEHIIIPEGYTKIDADTFPGRRSEQKLKSVTIPGSVTKINQLTFSGYSRLTDIEVKENNDNFASLDGVLFNKDRTVLLQYPKGKLGTHTIPDGVTEIGYWAFEGCTGLKSVTIPKSVKFIGDNAISNSLGLTIHAPADSCAEEYAKKNWIHFEAL